MIVKIIINRGVKMRKIISITLLIVLFIALNSVNNVQASTVNYDEYAKSLSDLGVFVGTNSGFELDRAPTRIEGIIMLIRLLGAEDDAKSMAEKHIPFTDVPNWANGYVAFAYENGLTKGISESKFGSANVLESKAYITFLLRSLGYDDGTGDFSYNNSINFSRSLELIDDPMQLELTSSTFLRAHVAKLSYDTLKFPCKGTDILLIDKLMSNDDIDIEVGNKFKENVIVGENAETNENKTIYDVAENSESIVMLQCTTNDGISQGSGIIINTEGEILTNFHVIEGSSSIIVYFNDGTIYKEDIYIQDYDKELDLAIIKINKSNLKSVTIGDSDTLRLGESIVAIGSPYGFFNTMTEGIVSAVRPNNIQISAAINPGSSGGGLFNYKGELIGVIYAGVAEADNLGFAIPINLIKQVSEKKLLSVSTLNVKPSMSPILIMPPKNIKIVSETYSDVYINWDDVTDAEYYYFYYQDDGDDTFWYDEENGSQMKYYYDWEYSVGYHDLEPGKRYNIIVTSIKDGKESADSEIFSFVKGYGSLYYDGYYGVPDFGKIFGRNPSAFVDGGYRYNYYDTIGDDVNSYKTYLLNNGFSYYSDFINDYGFPVYVYANKSLGLKVMVSAGVYNNTVHFDIYIMKM
jgi:hypothetical protein